MYSLGSVLEVYGHDRMIPAFGFGGTPLFLGFNDEQHCFPLNGNNMNPEI